MKKTVIACFMLLGLFSLSTAYAANSGISYPIYKETEGQWVAPKVETPKYASLENANKGLKEEYDANLWSAYLVKAQEGKWLHLVDANGEGEEFWADESSFTDLDSYLQNPPSGAYVNCEGEKPKDFQVDLDENHKGAWVITPQYPTIGGGGGIIEAWDVAKKTLLWHSGPLDKLSNESSLLTCYEDGDDTWLKFVGDLNGDGKAELVIKSAQTEIGPGYFTIMSWDGTAFITILKGNDFMVLDQAQPKMLPVRNNYTEEDLANIFDGRIRIWVDDIVAAPGDGTIVAELTMLGGETQRNGQAVLRVDKDWNLVWDTWNWKENSMDE